MWLSLTAAAAPPSVRPELVTTAPIDVGVGVLSEFGPRLRVATQVGLLPDPYLDGIEAGIGALDPTWTDSESELVDAALDGSVVWRTEAGWRFAPGLGLYLHGAYTFAGLGGSATAQEIVEGLGGVEIPTGGGPLGFDPDPVEFDATAALHLVGAELGWDQRLWRQLHLRVGVGWSFTVGSSTTIAPAFEPNPLAAAAWDAAGEAAADSLDGLFRGYAHPPTVTVAAGWSFSGR
ncbi:MAG: hypothetical protein ABMA64_19915 [Myxococcota bacterium]